MFARERPPGSRVRTLHWAWVCQIGESAAIEQNSELQVVGVTGHDTSTPNQDMKPIIKRSRADMYNPKLYYLNPELQTPNPKH
jgi:hypothetical protein